MKRLWIFVLLLPVVLTACAGDTAVTFRNDAECGTATVTWMNTETGNERVYTIDQGKSAKIEVDNGIAYHYSVVYERMSGGIQCDEKSGTVMLPDRGDSATFNLESATPTPDPSADSASE